jgi:hypothetical protein
MAKKIKLLGAFFALVGLAFVAGGIFAFVKVQAGAGSLQAFSEVENVTLSYNEDGQLVDRGETAGAEAIMKILKDDWKYPVNNAELDPNDPLVNTGTEYMYQMATITHHVIDQTVTVTLAEDTDFNGETLKAGDYEVDIAGKYWADFDRSNPLEGLARGQAWSDTALALSGQLGVGAVTASTLQMGYGISALIGGLGLIFLFTGGLMFWIAMPSKETDGAAKPAV